MHDEWLVSEGALLRLLGAGLPKVLLQAYFNHPTTLLIGAKHPNALVPKASLAGDFTSAAALISALDEHRMATHEKYVVLDLEAWRMTPSEEQRQPIQAAQQALTGAHAVGVRLIFTPGTDLVRVLEGHAPWQSAHRGVRSAACWPRGRSCRCVRDSSPGHRGNPSCGQFRLVRSRSRRGSTKFRTRTSGTFHQSRWSNGHSCRPLETGPFGSARDRVLAERPPGWHCLPSLWPGASPSGSDVPRGIGGPWAS